MRRRGFSLIEVMLAVAIVGVLASIALSEFTTFTMLARRTNAITGLRQLWSVQRAYSTEKGTFAPTFIDLGFKLEGGELIDETTYKSGPYTYQLSQPWGQASFYCIATAQLDSDAYRDVLEIYETNTEGK